MWDTVLISWRSLADPLHDPVVLAVPAFAAALTLEWAAAAALRQLEPETGERPVGAYERRDAIASLLQGVVSIGTSAGWKLVALVGYSAIWVYVAPWHLPDNHWATWALLLLGIDLLWYWYHRLAHRIRIIWATHQAHHSSAYFNFATALRQKWNNSGEIIMWLPLPLLGMPPWMVFTGFAVNLVYQFFVHTERVRRLPWPIEFVFNTPSHHRVHHGSDPEYLDRNYGGILILWDRLFGTFRAERQRPTYGLTKPVDTFNIWRLQTHEYAAIARDWRSTPKWREKLLYAFGPPGWSPTVAHPAEV